MRMVGEKIRKAYGGIGLSDNGIRTEYGIHLSLVAALMERRSISEMILLWKEHIREM